MARQITRKISAGKSCPDTLFVANMLKFVMNALAKTENTQKNAVCVFLFVKNVKKQNML